MPEVPPIVGAGAWKVIPDQRSALSAAQKADSDLSLLRRLVEFPNTTPPEGMDVYQWAAIKNQSTQFTVFEDVLYHIFNPDNRRRNADVTFQIALPKGWIPTILEMYHNWIISGGHSGWMRTYDKLKYHYWWPTMLKDVKHWIASCIVCQQRKAPRGPTVPNMARVLPSEPWEQMTMDVLSMGSGITSARGNIKVLVVNDVFSRWVEVYPIPNETSATIAKCLFEHICRFGCPGTIITDKAANFGSAWMVELYKLFGIRKIRTTAYHPQSNGISERANRTLLDGIACYLEPLCKQEDWDDWVKPIAFGYNTTRNATTQFTPYHILHGREARVPADLFLPTSIIADGTNMEYVSVNDYVNAARFELLRAHTLALQNLIDAGNKYESKTANAATLATYKKDEPVLIYRPYVPQGLSRKLSKLWSGPYVVMAKSGYVTYRVRPMASIDSKHDFYVHPLRMKKLHIRDGRFDIDPYREAEITEDNLEILDDIERKEEQNRIVEPDPSAPQPEADTYVEFEPAEPAESTKVEELQRIADRPPSPPRLPLPESIPQGRRHSSRAHKPVERLAPYVSDTQRMFQITTREAARRSAAAAARMPRSRLVLKTGTAVGKQAPVTLQHRPRTAIKTVVPSEADRQFQSTADAILNAAKLSRSKRIAIKGGAKHPPPGSFASPPREPSPSPPSDVVFASPPDAPPSPSRVIAPGGAYRPVINSPSLRSLPEPVEPYFSESETESGIVTEEDEEEPNVHVSRIRRPGEFWRNQKVLHPAFLEALREHRPLTMHRLQPADSTMCDGWGLFTVDKIRKDEYICEYHGVNRTEKQFEMAVTTQYASNPDYQHEPLNVYGFWFQTRHYTPGSKSFTTAWEVLDATLPKSMSIQHRLNVYGPGPLINHSKAKANVIARSIMIDRQVRVLFFAKREIPPGRELLYDYGCTNPLDLEIYPWLGV